SSPRLARRTSAISSLTGCSILGWMVLIRNLMQIFPTAPLDPQCYCTWWRRFSCVVLTRARQEGSPKIGGRLLRSPEGQIPRCPENACKGPYNQRLEGYSLRPPKALLQITAEHE